MIFSLFFCFLLPAFAADAPFLGKDSAQLFSPDGACSRAIREYSVVEVYLKREPDPDYISHKILLRTTLLYCAPLAFRTGHKESAYNSFLRREFCRLSTLPDLEALAAKTKARAVGTKWESQVNEDLRQTELIRKDIPSLAKSCREFDIPVLGARYGD